MDGTSRTLNYQYDADGNRTRLTHPDGTYFAYTFDVLDRFTHADWWTSSGGTVPFATVSYDSVGRRSSISRGASYTDYSYDAASRLSGQVQRFAGNAGNVTTTLGYNPANQIVSEGRDNSAFAFPGYVNVNRNYTVNGLNQYTAAGPASFTYDANGNLVSDGTNTYAYDAENRLIASGSVSLVYDPNGRLWRTSGGSYGTTDFLYDGTQLAAEYDGSSGSMRRRYMFAGGDEPILWDEGSSLNCSGTKFLNTDYKGTVVALANCSGNQAAVNSYDEHGIPASGNFSAGLQQRFQYTGQAWIPELGVYYFKARMYSPTLGRFLQTDPIGYGDGSNWYNYAHGDAINSVDPSGLDDVVVTGQRPITVEGAQSCTATSNCAPDAYITVFGNRNSLSQLDWLFPNILSGTGYMDGLYTEQAMQMLVINSIPQQRSYNYYAGANSTRQGHPCPPAPSLLSLHRVGAYVGANATIGLSKLGAFADGAAGIGVFGGHGGAFASGGASAVAGSHDISAPSQDNGIGPIINGLSGGVGGGILLTNANDVSQIKGSFSSLILNTPLGSANLSWGGGIWTFSAGPGLGIPSVSGTAANTYTVTAGDCQ